MLDENQKIVADAYCGGEYSHLKVIEKGFTRPHGCGDGLLTFLMIELSYENDCFSSGDALCRLDNIIEQVEEVKAAFEKLA